MPDEESNSLRRLGLWVVALCLSVLTMVSVGALLAWDALPQAFPQGAHALLGAVPLALIAVSALVYQAARRPGRLEIVKTAVLASAFLFWAANQLLPDAPEATLFNDLAIALFVVDVFLAIVGWPPRLSERASAARAEFAAEPSARSVNGANDLSRGELEHSDLIP